ncbi:hypothetical protein BJ912DRAFT_958275 [Pholiota molesta]|nr:hypothetical protein BJ912DRAFT_958275 [Pholiota molesta]
MPPPFMKSSARSYVARMNIPESPIDRLSRSLLQRIFQLNADMEDPSFDYNPQSRLEQEYRLSCAPLVVTRRTSQVCKEWRKAILSCPSLWGSILDFQLLSQRNNHWRSVVIRRTDNSLLSIKGRILNTGSPELQSFFLLLLKESWTRIFSLDVVLEVANLLRVPQTFFLSRFCFTNDSPRLRLLCVTGLRFQTRAPWFAHLQSLTLTCPFTLFEILDALTSAQVLEYLDLGTSDNLAAFQGHLYLPRPPTVPRLRTIFIRNTFITCITFLNNIFPAPECSLSMFASHINDVSQLSHADKILAAQVLAHYSQSYLSTHPATSYLVHAGYDWCGFAQVAVTPPPPSFFSIRLDEEEAIIEDALLVFLLAYSNLDGDLPKITTLHLDVALSAVDIPIRVRILLFFQSFSGVRELSVHGRDVLTYLLALAACEPPDPRFPFIAFPRLTKLAIENFNARCLGIVLDFLAWRRDLGVPIQTLHIVTSICNELRDFSLIEFFGGLEVVWTIWDSGHAREYTYICGSGDYEQLDLDYYVVAPTLSVARSL